MLTDTTKRRAVELGLRSGNDFWIVGRAGVLGNCDAAVAAACLAFHGPAAVREAWEALPAGLTHREVASEYAALCAAWGDGELSRFDPARMSRLNELGRRVINAADGSIGALFAGWRAMPEPESIGGRVALTGHVLRELRGCAHIVAVAACGITPLDAVLASPAPAPRTGTPWAESMHFTGPFRDPDEVRPARMEAEKLTSRILYTAYGSLSSSELEEFAELIESTRNAIDM